ncbi:hypothetical protein M422DRAFT_263280 [Sphaerobolus stellatus SS14]|uniref:Unplaced genomic scaffold SPHSTscaffold_123, whole genome shotgun sequence n=1 Tax=Sphaerobolus stellatus (strain SS14) TaxID=990650 RepID=A0A0C9VB48_SPHS4|nr:hypothetical protein M422DRAFT_263280 [Sphaerobolus stellatus SS14]
MATIGTNSSFPTTRDHPGSSRGGVSAIEMDRERDTSRYASRRNMEYKSRHSAIQSGAISPSITGSSGRPLSRADSWSNSRPGPLFARTISDLVSGHGDSAKAGQSRPASSPKQSTVRGSSTSSSIFPVIPKTLSFSWLKDRNHQLGHLAQLAHPTLTNARPSKISSEAEQSEPPLQLHDPPTEASLSIPATHKRSMSGASVATSANFSIETGSPGSLKLKHEHEFLLGDVTQVSYSVSYSILFAC